jgi:hypothetical protein
MNGQVHEPSTPVALEPAGRTIVARRRSVDGEIEDRERTELMGAIALVASGEAVRISLCGLCPEETTLVTELTPTAAAMGVVLRTRPRLSGGIDIEVGRH